MDAFRETVAAHVHALNGRVGEMRISRDMPPWLWVRRFAVPLHQGSALSMNLAFRLPPTYPAQPPSGFYTHLAQGWVWHPLALVNWPGAGTVPLGSFLRCASSLLQEVLSLPRQDLQVPDTMRFYHGTSLARANSILASGFQPQGHYAGEGRVYFSRDPNYSWAFSQAKSAVDGTGQALLVCRIDLNRYRVGEEYQLDGDQVVYFRRAMPAGVVVELQRR